MTKHLEIEVRFELVKQFQNENAANELFDTHNWPLICIQERIRPYMIFLSPINTTQKWIENRLLHSINVNQ